MGGTSRARRHLHVVEPTHDRHEVTPHEPQEPPGKNDDEVPQPGVDNGAIIGAAGPDSIVENSDRMDAGDQADLDARLAGMAVLLRVALKVMKEYDTSLGWRG
jgi:hypothetical protein